jgi:shikimate kinase
VEHEAGASVAALFAGEGERGFRRREAAAIRHVAALRGQVIAVGGGAVLDPANVTQLRATGDLVLLSAEVDVLGERVAGGEERPLLAGRDPVTTLTALQTARAAAYAAAATHTIDTTDLTPAEAAEQVLEWARRQPGLLSGDELTL